MIPRCLGGYILLFGTLSSLYFWFLQWCNLRFIILAISIFKFALFDTIGVELPLRQQAIQAMQNSCFHSLLGRKKRGDGRNGADKAIFRIRIAIRLRLQEAAPGTRKAKDFQERHEDGYWIPCCFPRSRVLLLFKSPCWSWSCVLGINYFITLSCSSCCFQSSMCYVEWWASLLCNGTNSCDVWVRNWMTRLRQSQQSSQEPTTLGWSNHILAGPWPSEHTHTWCNCI